MNTLEKRKPLMKMGVYLVTFNLRNKEKTLEPLTTAIKAYPGWCKAWETQWFIVANENAEGIAKNLQTKLSASDFIFVSEITDDYVALLTPNVAAWIKETRSKISKQRG